MNRSTRTWADRRVIDCPPSTGGPDCPPAVGTVDVDHEAATFTVDQGLLDLLGVSHDVFRNDGDAVLARIHPEDRRQLLHTAVPAASTPEHRRFRFDVGANRTYRWFEARLDIATTDPSRVVGVVVDVNDLMADLTELERSRRFQEAVIAAAPDVFHIYDVETGSLTRLLSSGPSLRDMSDEAIDVVSGRRIDELVPPVDRARLRQAFSDAVTSSDTEWVSLRHRVLEPDGRISWLRRRIAVVTRGIDGRASTLVVVSGEITTIMMVEQRLKHAAEHDDLTGLPNRRKLTDEIENRLRTGEGVALITLNIDDFRPVNELYGRKAGDAVLSAVARRLGAAVRGSDMVARIGGDEFALLVTTTPPSAREHDLDLTIDMHVDGIVQRVEQLLREPFHIAGAEITLSTSAGICLSAPDDNGTDGAAERMIGRANSALDWLRRTGESGHYIFDQRLREELSSLEHVERNLRRALREDALEVYYQPIVAPSSGTVSHVEALVRLRDEDGQMLPVDQIIAVAERCSLVAELDDQMLAKACRQVALWRRDPRYADLRLALNRSAKDLNRPGFCDRIMKRLAASDLPADALILEITETVLLHVTKSRVAEMSRLHDSLVSLAIDDFGTGYASMSQLVTLPISSIKVDRSFTARILDDPTCAALVRAAVTIASDLGISCVVEGVETVEQLRALPRYERLFVQGYLYGRPREPEFALDIALPSLV